MSGCAALNWRLASIALALLIAAACAETPTTRKAARRISPTPAATGAGTVAGQSGDTTPAGGGTGESSGDTGSGSGAGGSSAGGGATQAPAIRTGSLAIALDQARQVQAVDAIVAKVRFSVGGPNLAATASRDVLRTDFVGGKATVRFDGLVPGPASVEAIVYDSGDRVLGQGRGGPIDVVADQARNVDMAFSYASGSITVILDGPIAPTPAIAIGSGG